MLESMPPRPFAVQPPCHIAKLLGLGRPRTEGVHVKSQSGGDVPTLYLDRCGHPASRLSIGLEYDGLTTVMRGAT